MPNITGSILSGKELSEDRKLVQQSRKGAKQYKWLYQCTCIDKLKNIIGSREIWLTNLKDVNDKEEANRINIPDFENSYFVSCFTYEDNIDQQHWYEYGHGKNGILYGFKREWVKKEAEFILDNGEIFSNEKHFKIYRDSEETNKITLEEKKFNNRECYPYYFFDFGFYKIIYDDELQKTMDCPCEWQIGTIKLDDGIFISQDLPGIIKKTKGECHRNGGQTYTKNWENEKEVRLKAGIQSDHELLPNDIHFQKLAVKLTDNAFDELIIRFSPDMPEEMRRNSLKDLEGLLPDSKIQILE